MRNWVIGSLSCCLLWATPNVQACSVSSTDQRVSLLELYTSEGCSSCPPADQWLSRLQAAGYPTDKVIPLALHVDYWDYIGWKDRFARPEFTARQRQAASRDLASFVYTPQVLLNGRDFRGWQQANRFGQALEAYRSQAARVQLRLDVTPQPSGQYRLKLDAKALDADSRKQGDVYIAVYENGLKTKVNAGENSGRELSHDHVVREWRGPYRLQDATGASWESLIMLDKSWQGRDAGVAAFVQNRSSGEVLQAVATDLCG